MKNKPNHTPGPWKAMMCGTIISSQSHPICHLSHQFHRELESGETGNDAPLIAAAPEMLEALNNLENDNRSIPSHAWDMVQAAILKAEGGKS